MLAVWLQLIFLLLLLLLQHLPNCWQRDVRGHLFQEGYKGLCSTLPVKGPDLLSASECKNGIYVSRKQKRSNVCAYAETRGNTAIFPPRPYASTHQWLNIQYKSEAKHHLLRAKEGERGDHAPSQNKIWTMHLEKGWRMVPVLRMSQQPLTGASESLDFSARCWLGAVCCWCSA